MTPHAILVNEILLRLGKRRDVKVWRQSHVEGQLVQGERTAHVNSGPDGQGDVGGIIVGTGRRLDIEAKTGTGRQSKSQVRWQRMSAAAGGLYFVARSAEDAEQQLDRALKDYWSKLHALVTQSQDREAEAMEGQLD